ncbi:hypothetical protein O0I10_001685 [Lichtheimia ornata]|uniref:White collar 1 protein n=1 Tax=Lichtheimia ornata TaxID=688661 RepID=A0AAD7Y289_9FUNG|nr:uncharacterized protein O0I10_001685 [Lichtheimia ornata]KAJ8662721.1 hypothetical protein O0I10_001685 [Lichtheimia ornata]
MTSQQEQPFDLMQDSDDDAMQLGSGGGGVPMTDLTAAMDPFAGILDAESTDPTFDVVGPQSTAPPAPTTSALPVSTSTSGGALTGVYSSSGFDMIGILSRVVNRPNPLINLGPIDMSCSFLVTDARQFDCPIVYCSPNFETLTGYKSDEILGRNCRFLQAPDGLVTEGSRRQHTDNLAVYHLKSYLLQAKEHQASIINYKKGGQPFVNLVTVIPVPDDSNETAFFVGLQIDLVEQPNAILEKMKNNTYMINYQQINIPPYIPSQGVATDPVDEYFYELPSSAPITSITRPEVLRLIACTGDNEQQVQQEWNRLLLDQSRDFIHVLSLKGFFLYSSRSCSKLLEYDPEELVGHSLGSICHPSDIVPVMRDIKDAVSSGDQNKVISLLYRVRRKYSGYMWFECKGKIHMDVNKGRKCLILAGRERSVYHLDRKEVANANATAIPEVIVADPLTSEFWCKMSLEGLFLRVTKPVEAVLGYTPKSLQGSSVYRFAGDSNIPDISRALGLVSRCEIVNLTHTIRNTRGQYVQVVSTFYPGNVSSGVGKADFALVQMRLANNDDTKRGAGEQVIGEGNLFAELETVRSTSWQYEMHQLEQANAKLRAEIEELESGNNDKKRKKKVVASTTEENPKICAHCHRKDSPEWRRGPNGPKELCNACGLKYAKAMAAASKRQQEDPSSSNVGLVGSGEGEH